jgi:UDP-glucuronate decarboxylase
VFHDLPSDDPRQRQPDITLARDVLGWEPKVALRDGLGKTVTYFERMLREGIAV